MTKVGFIGLGRMGHGMAGRYLDAGFSVAVWNRSKVKAEDLIARGARWASSPADAADGADAVVTMVADDEASHAVWLGESGAAATMKAGSLAIECSTVSHQHALDMARELRGRGLIYIDCPVTGLPQAAAAGKLTLLVGAEPADLVSAKPYLAPIGDVVRHFGVVGTGTVFKLINNLMGAVQIASLAEGRSAGDRRGGKSAGDPSLKTYGGSRFLRRVVHVGTSLQGCGLRGETRREPAGRPATRWARSG
jgi:3-hydroxyisobutyrate dehydrogenase-like beta-hydroxyacid dehydrogenase